MICKELSKGGSLATERASFYFHASQMRPVCCWYSSCYAKRHCQWQLFSNIHEISMTPGVMQVSGRPSINTSLLTKYNTTSTLVTKSRQEIQIRAPQYYQPLVQPPTASVVSQPQEAPCIKSPRFILMDGKAIVYRAYYKVMAKLQHGGQISDTAGDSDWVSTVFTALLTVLRIFELSPSHMGVVFDYEGLTFRHTIFPDYKLHRNPTPDTVIDSLRYIKPALTAMGIRAVEVPGVEADDVIGTLAVSAIKAEAKVRIVSPDKDFFQIVSPSLRLLRFAPRGSEIASFGLEEFQERFQNLEPSQFVDVLALMGDQVDNIPGVTGIGEKTAVKLIKLYGNLENLMKERNSVKGKRALDGLLADKGEVFLSKRLVTLRTDLPHYIVPLGLDDFVYKQPEDGGQRFFNLIKAIGSFVDGPHLSDIEKRTRSIWTRY